MTLIPSVRAPLFYDILDLIKTKIKVKTLKKYVVYGAGGFGRDCIAALLKRDGDVAAILDRNPTLIGTDFNGIPILLPEEGVEVHHDATLVIGVFNPFSNLNDLAKWSDTHFVSVLTPQMLVFHFPELARYWLQPIAKHTIDEVHDNSLRELFVDEKSRQVFDMVLAYRKGDSLELDAVTEPHNQYLPDFISFDKPINFIDVGAYDGDTYRQFRANNIEFSSYIGFEPDHANYLKLLAEVNKNNNGPSLLLPLGLSDRFDQFPIEGSGSSAKMGDAGSSNSQMCRSIELDSAFPGLKCDYIKMDIEGAELSALVGMQETIIRNQPIVALSVYHKFDDIPVLSAYLNKLLPKSQLYLRQHGFSGFDTVLYCIPY
jgi:FkbM family methyltransferase